MLLTLFSVLLLLLLLYRRRSQQLEHARRGVDGSIACASPLCGLHNYHITHYADADLTGMMPAPAPSSAKSAGGGGGGSAATSPGGDPGYASCPTTENDYFQTWQLQRHAANCSAVTPSRRSLPGPGPQSQRPVLGALPLAVDTAAAQHSGRPYVEHIYESPKFERREFIPPPLPATSSSTSHVGAIQQRSGRECVCCAPPQAASAAVNRCVQYLDTELTASQTTAARV